MAKKGQKQKLIDENLILKIVKEKINGKSYSYLSLTYSKYSSEGILFPDL